MKKRWIISVLLCGLAVVGYAQNFEDEFNAFANQTQRQFNNFVDSINKQFAEAMVANMKAFNGEQPKVRDTKPKPVNVPKAPQPTPQPEPQIPPQLQREPLPDTDPQRPDRPANPELEKPAPATPAVDQIKVAFNLFGKDVQILKEPFPDRLSGITPKNVSDFWIRLSECDYQEMMQACRDAHEKAAFNDWAIYQMVLEFARKTYDERYNEQAVMAVFLLNQLGKEAKVGFDDQHLFCLLAVDQQLYGVSYADVSDYRYYMFETDPSYSTNKGRLFRTYDMPFPKKTQSMDMNIQMPLKNEMAFGDAKDEILINKNMIELYKTYPQVDIEVYANAAPSKVFSQSVEKIFRPYLKDFETPYDAVSFLLAYLQYGFDYATDDEQFGFEKPFFCEENYYYPKNDCEDRSILFSYLVRHLLHLEVVLIDYPGHIATAVHFPTEVKGESVMYKGKRYVICDPTYIGAGIGVTMPRYKNVKANVIELKK